MRPTPRQQVRRSKERARYETAAIHAVLDAGFLAHVGFSIEGQPFVIPMLYARDGEEVLLHGSIASRLMRGLAEGIPACLSVSHVDGLVLARSHFHHSVNYRSVVCFGTARSVDDPAEKAAALARFVDAILPGRAAESRPSDRNELAATLLLRFVIEDASAKVREGGPRDDPADLGTDYWAGVVPLQTRYAAAVSADDCTLPLPPSVVRVCPEAR
ncbi:MAG: pyridoxamine 5'-phosphate oxidase family protein [Rhodanobacteraceae bacterium]|nr:pyridoxamine 5'-phosphate oxidase family protein [Rhodanobacteraceae bacterium]